MKVTIPLKALRLWWPVWQLAIPFTGYGYGGVRKEVSGEGYLFYTDTELDSWCLLEDSAAQYPYKLTNPILLPIAEAQLVDCDEGPISYTSFSILPDNTVQVNVRTKDGGYEVSRYPIECLSMVGEGYTDADDV